MSGILEWVVAWTLYLQLWFFLVLEALLCVWFMAWVWFLWAELRRERRFRVEARRYGSWCCPNCHELYGALETWLTCDGNSIDERGEPVPRHVVLLCRQCRFSTTFDANGRPNLLTVHQFEPGKMERDWERWEKNSEGWKCPRCGELYQGWTGWIRGDRQASGPVMKCGLCDTDALIIEKADGVEYTCVRVPSKAEAGRS